MCVKLILLSHCALDSASQHSVSVYNGEYIDTRRFNSDVSKFVAAFSSMKAEQFALYYEQAYPFCVLLYALLHSEKKIWIASNNTLVTADNLTKRGCLLLGNWQGKEFSVEPNEQSVLRLEPLNIDKQQLTIFTSGSSGQPKAISKSLQQFQREIETLELYWGQQLGQSEVLATVSHQHIYGLLFRVLWPLAAGRCFHSEMYLSPEPLLKVAGNISAHWVASPAQLKRLDELTPWQDMAALVAIFSSGGALPIEAAVQIYNSCEQKIWEIYGSSETGGIAWRQSIDNQFWTAFDGIRITQDKGGESYLSSPYIATQTPFLLDDRIKLVEDDRFVLLGRVGRIVKVEEKRLSLDALEQMLNCSDWVQQSYTFLLSNKRDKICSVLVLTDSGKKYLQQQPRSELIKQLRKQLVQGFESVVLPRKWIFMLALPQTAQGKINRELLVQMFSLDLSRFPQILDCDNQNETVELQLRVPPGLIYFSGHFPEHPILPGVTQLAWAEYLGKMFFNFNLPFLRMEVIKFKKIIRPGDIIEMKLNWKESGGKLYFEFSSKGELHSSGRMVYGES